MVLNNKATEAKETLILLSQLRDPRNLVLAVGLAQLLEPYCDASITSQHSSHFPTQLGVNKCSPVQIGESC